MPKHREAAILFLLTTVYLLCGLRYFPDQPQKTAVSTIIHLLMTAPFIIGSLLMINSLVRKTSGEKLAANKLARFYLTGGIVIEFFIGLYNYLQISA
ncbi:MAG: hypothetical protein KKG47_00745 [Proteobacteria bacterium]|nr:hypothetical protein [Pseudomonadota bacterium]MBU1737267.1 hypothetical protein [Pseudomonadota bacterium]